MTVCGQLVVKERYWMHGYLNEYGDFIFCLNSLTDKNNILQMLGKINATG